MADKHDKDDDAPKTIKVEALQAHTYNGKAYEVGDEYDIDAQLVDSVTAQGKAIRADRVAFAKQQAKDQEAARKAASHPVEPMTTENTGRTRK